MSEPYTHDMRGAPRAADRRRERRASERLDALLVLGAEFLDAEADAEKIAPLRLYGYTRDMSASGIGVIIPSINFDPRACSRGLPLTIKLMHPCGAEVRAEAVYCEPLDEREPHRGVRLGTKLSAADERARAFLRSRL